MPVIMQMLGVGLLLIGLGFAVWVSFWLLLVLFGIGAALVALSYIRGYLTAKGILNPTPGIPPEQADHITIVEGDFERIDISINGKEDTPKDS